MLTNEYKRLPLDEIKVDRDNRHRRTLNTENLKPSIARRGVFNPIIIDRDHVLIAGERRLTASRELGLPDIPIRYVEELTPSERRAIELEENIKRTDLTWEEEAHAILDLHAIFCEAHDSWTYSQTAQEIGLSSGMVSMNVRVAEELNRGNRRITDATSLRQAYNTLSREDNRRASDAVSDLISAVSSPIHPGGDEDDERGDEEDTEGEGVGYTGSDNPDRGSEVPRPPLIRPIERTILNVDFHAWAETYKGPRFNLLHCDFPYGINMQKSAQGNTKQWGGYQDTPDIYWELLRSLAKHQDRLFGLSCHIMFWFSMNFYEETMEFFRRELSEWDIQPVPLIWLKSDNKGILPDPKRGPRRVYETALIGSRGDRHVVKAVSNAYPCPTAKSIHQSEKPEPMLRHFFQMFVDEHTRMLDPTCGGGSAIRAAESLGAATTLGLERDPEFAEAARTELKRFRALRSMATGGKDAA